MSWALRIDRRLKNAVEYSELDTITTANGRAAAAEQPGLRARKKKETRKLILRSAMVVGDVAGRRRCVAKLSTAPHGPSGYPRMKCRWRPPRH